MTGTLWALVAIGFVVGLVSLGWIVGGRHVYRQLERDTGGWKYPPIH